MEIDTAIFQDLKSFGKGKFFNMAMEKFWIFVWENPTTWKYITVVLSTLYVVFLNFAICSIKRSPPRNYTI